MDIAIIAASDLPIPAFKGGATETIITELLNDKTVNNPDLHIDVYSHCEGETIEKNNVTYHFYKKGKIEGLYFVCMRLLRLFLFRKIYIPDIFPIVLYKQYKVNLNKYDVIILEGSMQQVVPIRYIYEKKLVLHIHTVMTMMNGKRLSKNVIKRCDTVIANSRFAQDEMRKIAGCYSEKIQLLPNCICLNKYNTNKNTRMGKRAELGIDKDEFIILYVGRIEKGKGVLELIKAYKKSGVKGKLLIVGSSWFASNKKTKYIKTLENEAKNIRDRIIFTGYITHEEIPEYYAAADVLIAPSQYLESAGLVILEAQASGLPVIISDIGGMPEYVNGRSVLKVRTGKKFVDDLSAMIIEIEKDNDLYRKEKEMAIDHVKKFGMDRYAKDFIRLVCSQNGTS